MSKSLYPREIIIPGIYFLRKRKDLSIKIIKITQKISKTEYYGMVNFKYFEVVDKADLLLFNMYSTFFKWVLRSGIYKSESDFRKALYRLGCKSDDLHAKVSKNLNTLDSNISLKEFESEYALYCKEDGQYQVEFVKQFGSFTVPGTKGINAYNLYKVVCSNGGMEAVTNDQKWKSLFYQSGRKTNISYTVRTFYKKYLLEFEYFRRHQEEPSDYKFTVGEIASFISDNDERYYGKVKIRRNRGMNQYYLQFLGWEKEYSEWYCEDVLEKTDRAKLPKDIIKKPPKSSKNNYLINDPLIREKHSHYNLGKIAYEGIEEKCPRKASILPVKSRRSSIIEEDEKNECRLEGLLQAIDYQRKKPKTTNQENYIKKIFPDEPSMENKKENQKKKISAESEEEYLKSTLKLKQLSKAEKEEIKQYLKPLKIKGKEPTMTEYNYFFLNFFQ